MRKKPIQKKMRKNSSILHWIPGLLIFFVFAPALSCFTCCDPVSWSMGALVSLRVIRKNTRFIRKNPQSTKSIQRGEIWQFPSSKRKGPIFWSLVKNAGAQFTPIPEANGLKKRVKGSEIRRNDAMAIPLNRKNDRVSLKRKKEIVSKRRKYIGPSKALVI